MSLKHLKYSCDVPCWFIDQYNELLEAVIDLQQRVGDPKSYITHTGRGHEQV